MQTLRRARYLARLVLAGFALALGVAIASPIVQPKTMELVCSVGGAVKLVVNGADGADGAAASHGNTLDCPLCLHVQALPPVPEMSRQSCALPAGDVSWSVTPTHRSSIATALPPSRAPPFNA